MKRRPLKPKKSHSTMTLEEKERITQLVLKENGYKPKERQKIIDRAFYEDVNDEQN